MKQSKAIELGSLLFWGAFSSVAISMIYDGTLSGVPAIAWSIAFVIFGAVLIIDSFSGVYDLPAKRRETAIFFALTLSGFVMVYFANGVAKYASALALVLAARRLPYITSERNAWLAVGAIEIILVIILGWQVGWLAILGNGGTIGASLIFVVAFSIRTIREHIAREELAIANAELQANRELFAEHSRAAERLRISRDLHDTLGHHLTALSIQLDVAARRSEGAASDHIREAHAITRLLLSDVRDVVGQLRFTVIDLTEQLRRLTTGIGDLNIYIEMPEKLRVNDPEKSDALLRCVQEIVTNARRHAAAKNLWIRIVPTADGLELNAHDDGRGAEQIKFGHGLSGMRERFAKYGGRIEVTSSSQDGFTLHAFLPQEEATP